MRSEIYFIIVGFLVLFSCKQHQEQIRPNLIIPEMVEVQGYIVPKDSIALPKVIHAGNPMVVKAGPPLEVPANVNVRVAGAPKPMIAGTPHFCTPGKDSFSLPEVRQAVNRPFVAGVPEVVVAKEAYAKEQNAQSFSSFSQLQGLVSTRINSMVQDKDGNIWFAGYGGGLARYDGRNFTNYTVKEGLGENFILKIYEDKTGNIWIGTRNHGVSKYDGKNFTNYTENEGLCNNNVQSILEDRHGNIWLGTGNGVSRYDGTNFTNYSNKAGLVDNYVTSIAEDGAGNLWFGTGAGVSKFDGTNFFNYTIKNGLVNDDVASISEDKAGMLWFGTKGGLSKFDGSTFINYTVKEGLSSNTIRSILQDQSGDFWFGTGDRGITKYDGKYFTHLTETEGLSTNSVNCILEDKFGTLWFGTEGGGVSKFNGKTFTHFTKKEGLSNSDVWNIFEDKSGNIWIGTLDGGIVKYNRKSFSVYTKKQGLPGSKVWSTLQSKAGDLWFGIADNGIVKFDGKTFTNYTKKEGLCDDNVRSMIQDRSGNFWIGTYDGGVSKFDGKTFTNFTTKEGLSDDQVFKIYEDRSGNIWFGTRENGLTRYDGKTFTHYTVKEGLRENTVLGICEDHLGNLWFGTTGALTKYNGRSFTHFTEKEGLSNNEVWSVNEDRSGNIWAGTTFGLNKLSQKSLARLPAKEAMSAGNEVKENNKEVVIKPLFKSYSYEDGFLGIGAHPALIEDKNGTLWIGANDRVTLYHPSGDKPDTIPPNIQLTQIALFNEKIRWVKDTNFILSNGVNVGNFTFDSLSRWYNVPQLLSLPYNNNYLTFSFIGITTKSPQKVKYQYKLEGLDKSWNALTTRAEAAYGNLPHGYYTFKVKAMNSEGYWSKELEYPFTIRPPWWRTTWAYAFYGFCLLAAVFAIDRYQRRRLIANERARARERELEQAREIEKAYHKLKATQAQLIQSEKMASLGQLTAGIAHEIQNPLNFVNNFSEINTELIEELEQEAAKGNIEEVKAIANDLKENEQKIIHHGKRADSIVKGMLQHSRTNKGVKEPTDINALVDECIRLSYHGMRAKDKEFNATINTNFDDNIGKINIVPQDISRVMLNLLNNAFYAVNEKKAKLNGAFEPTVSVCTKKLDGKVEIQVKDDGSGIPQNIIDKIFQPFFTTRPTGQGTGLGLSLSYDIIKAHGGEIKVGSKEGEGADFTVVLPAYNVN